MNKQIYTGYIYIYNTMGGISPSLASSASRNIRHDSTLPRLKEPNSGGAGPAAPAPRRPPVKSTRQGWA